MKKILSCIIVLGTISNANALPMIQPGSTIHTYHSSEYHQGYKNGYDSGKNRAYGNVFTTVVIVGGVILLGTAIYELGKESRWTANENGVVYRF